MRSTLREEQLTVRGALEATNRHKYKHTLSQAAEHSAAVPSSQILAACSSASADVVVVWIYINPGEIKRYIRRLLYTSEAAAEKK